MLGDIATGLSWNRIKYSYCIEENEVSFICIILQLFRRREPLGTEEKELWNSESDFCDVQISIQAASKQLLTLGRNSISSPWSAFRYTSPQSCMHKQLRPPNWGVGGMVRGSPTTWPAQTWNQVGCVHCGERIVPSDREIVGFKWHLWAARAEWLFGGDVPVLESLWERTCEDEVTMASAILPAGGCASRQVEPIANTPREETMASMLSGKGLALGRLKTRTSPTCASKSSS